MTPRFLVFQDTTARVDCVSQLAEMSWNAERQHSLAEEVIATMPERPLRPLTVDEKLASTTINVDSRGTSAERESDINIAPSPKETGILARLRDLEGLMDRKLGVESEAIDRKLPEDRKHVPWHSQLNMALLWASGTMNVSCFATGMALSLAKHRARLS